MGESIIIIGYSGHAYVVCGIFNSNNRPVIGYCEKKIKVDDPFKLQYFGSEKSEKGISALRKYDYFIAIGNNKIRHKVQSYISKNIYKIPTIAIHSNAWVDPSVIIGDGVMVSANAVLNPLVKIGNGVICNSGCIIEHDCIVEDFAHIAPGTVLAGNVQIGAYSFVGANSVIKEGVTVGRNVTIGAGAVIINDIPNGATVVGNPGKIIKKHA